MAHNAELLDALLAVMQRALVSDVVRHELAGVALVLAQRPNLAADLGLVLTEHTAAEPSPLKRVQVYAQVELHPYEPTSDDICSRWLPNLDAQCGYSEDSPAHRVETLGEGSLRIIDILSRGPSRLDDVPWSVYPLRHLRFVFKDGLSYELTARGRAWLEAHPQGGEPS